MFQEGLIKLNFIIMIKVFYIKKVNHLLNNVMLI